MPKRKVSKKRMDRYHCIETPIDYSNDGREEERREAQADRDHQFDGAKGR